MHVHASTHIPHKNVLKRPQKITFTYETAGTAVDNGKSRVNVASELSCRAALPTEKSSPTLNNNNNAPVYTIIEKSGATNKPVDTIIEKSDATNKQVADNDRNEDGILWCLITHILIIICYDFYYIR